MGRVVKEDVSGMFNVSFNHLESAIGMKMIVWCDFFNKDFTLSYGNRTHYATFTLNSVTDDSITFVDDNGAPFRLEGIGDSGLTIFTDENAFGFKVFKESFTLYAFQK